LYSETRRSIPQILRSSSSSSSKNLSSQNKKETFFIQFRAVSYPTFSGAKMLNNSIIIGETFPAFAKYPKTRVSLHKQSTGPFAIMQASFAAKARQRVENNNINLKEEMSFLYTKYTNNTLFLNDSMTPNTKLVGAWLCYGRGRPSGAELAGLCTIKRHFPPSTKEWNNSVYAYNSKITILLSAIDKIVIKLIKSYFNAYFLSSPKIRKLSVLSKVYVSKPEIKHTNSKVIITIYKYGSSLNEEEKNKKIKINDWQNKHINNTTLIHNSRDVAFQDNNNNNNNNNNIYYLSDLISKFYNKKVIFRIIDLKYLHLNTSILVEYLSNQLTNRKKILRKYRFLLRQIKLPLYNKHKYNSIIYNNALKKLSLLNNISNLSVENLKQNQLVNKDLLTNLGLSSIKYKAVVGARFEIGGRLTRRNIASKSVFKFGQVGTLKNIDASYKEMPVVTLRGYHRPNLDYSSFPTKTRNGSFNVKG
jgi:hypothetical protein